MGAQHQPDLAAPQHLQLLVVIMGELALRAHVVGRHARAARRKQARSGDSAPAKAHD